MERKSRQRAVSAHKRSLILDAARDVFAEEGLEGASLRAVAARAGYTPAALYFHFDSKEALYAEVLQASLVRLGKSVAKAASVSTPEDRLMAVSMAFFRYYAKNSRDLDLGFYLFRGGMKPAGLGKDRDIALNDALEMALQPIADAARALGASPEESKLLMVDTFAHATGLLVLLHTGRIRMFDASASALMKAFVQKQIDEFERRKPAFDA